MITASLDLSREDFESASGWKLKPEGACKGPLCIPLGGSIDADAERVDVKALAERLGMPVLHDAAHGVYAVGPASGGHVLASAECPEIRLPDWKGKEFSLSSLRGRKVVLVAWASW